MRPVWNGAISFGLVNIPCDLITAEVTNDLKFHLVDSRDEGRIKYERVNEDTGEEVPWNKIVKAYEFSDDNYVIVTDEDFEKADVKATKTIDIESFVNKDEVDMVYFEKPYYVRPKKGGEKAYILFRDALEKSGKIAIARVVIRTREYLAAIFQERDFLIMDLLRFHHELRSPEDISIPSNVSVKEREVELALKLIEDMSEEWEPEKYKDEYRLALMERIRKKAEGMNIEVPEDEEDDNQGKVVDIMDLLKQSVENRGKKSPSSGDTEEKEKDNTGTSKTTKTDKTSKSTKTTRTTTGKTAAAKEKSATSTSRKSAGKDTKAPAKKRA